MPEPSAAEQPKNHPTASQPMEQHPTTPLPATDPASQPATPDAAQPAAEPPAADSQASAGPTATAAEAPQAGPATPHAASAAEPPPPPHVAAAGPEQATAPPPRKRFRQVVAHRATQLVAVGVLGLIIGGGLVALLDHDGYRGGHGRPGFSRMDERGAPGPAPRPGPHGPGWDDRGHFER